MKWKTAADIQRLRKKEICRVNCFREVWIPKSIQTTDAGSLNSQYVISLGRDALHTVLLPMREELIVTRIQV